MYIFKNKLLLVLFLLLETLLIAMLYYRQQYVVQDFLKIQTATAEEAYTSLYSGFQKVSQMAYAAVRTDPEVIALFSEAAVADEERKKALRIEMASLLHENYRSIREQKFKEMHFYLPDNHSFMRMNAPERVGYEINGILSGVARVNSDHLPTEGFEVGKHAGLFRFVYPLFDKNKAYIGCVEFSVSPMEFVDELEKLLDIHLHFIVNKEMLSTVQKEQYRKSFENENFLKMMREAGTPDDPKDILDHLYGDESREEIAYRMVSDDAFSILLDKWMFDKQVTFLVVKRGETKQVEAFFTLFQKDVKGIFLGVDYWVRVAAVSLALLGVFLLLSFYTNRKVELTRSVEKKNDELESLNQRLNQLVQERTDSLHKESQFLRELLDALPIYIFWKDRDKNYIGGNALFAKMAGVENVSEIVGKDDFAFAWHNHALAYRATDEEVITTGKAHKNYISNIDLPGDDAMIVSISKVPLRDTSGEVIGVLGAFSDITVLTMLQKEQEKLATVLNLNVNEVYIFELDSDNASFANCSAIHGLGYTHDEMKSISLSNLCAGDRDEMESALQSLRDGSVKHRVVVGENRRKDGTTYPVETHFQRIDLEDRPQLVAISVDISERLAAEKEIQRINERYELTLAGIGDGVWDWDLVEDTIYFSKRWKEMLGYDENELKNEFQEWQSRIHPDDMKQTFADFEANISGKTEQYENLHRLKHKDGHWVWVLGRGKTIFDEEGRPVRMLGTHTDVSEKKALENKMARNEARLMEAQSIAHLGSWEWDIKEHKIRWSDELYKLLGEVPQSFTPALRTILSYLVPSERARYRKNLRDILNNKEVGSEHSWNIVRKDGVNRTISATIKVVRDGEKIVYVQGTFLDVTERKEVEETLALMNSMLVDSYQKQKQKTEEILEAKRKLEESHTIMEAAKAEAERASSSKSEFLANMSHEIRTPLNAMNGFISLLKEDEHNESKRKYFEIIENSSETLLQIINDILDCSKIESGKLEIVEVDFQPKKELYGTAKLFQAKAAEKEIALGIRCNENIPKTLHGDVLRLKQVLSNLLSNAIKFTGKQGKISCMITYDEGQLHLRVEDNGIGIAEDKQQHIFASFAQADTSIVREYGGTGLGLTISAKLVEMLGGELKVESTLGEGSAFFFSVPVSLGEDSDVSSEEVQQEHGNLDGHLLLVEDNEANRMFVGIILSGAGLTYEVAENGVEAVEKFSKGRFDLILMDENMPKLNGIGATKAILKIEEEQGLVHTPIIALTANALIGDRQHFIDEGMDDYLAKPIEPPHLLEKIGSLLGKEK